MAKACVQAEERVPDLMLVVLEESVVNVLAVGREVLEALHDLRQLGVGQNGGQDGKEMAVDHGIQFSGPRKRKHKYTHTICMYETTLTQ